MASVTETARAIVDLDGKAAGEKIKELRKQAKDLKEELKQLKISGDKTGFEAKKRELNGINKKLDEARRSTWDLQKVMQNLNGTSLKDLERAQRQLTNEIRNASRATDEERAALKRKAQQLGQVKQEISKLKVETGQASNANKSFLSGMANGFNKYFGIITAGIATITGLAFSLKNALSYNAELSDSMADVAKSTGMSMTEVKTLNQELRKIDTRTTRKELLDLAYVAGKLGYTTEHEVMGFVKAADQIGVSLSKDLGGNVEDAVNSLGKLVDIFGIKGEYGIEDALLKTGSAINALGAASTANESYIVDFTRRLGGIAPQAGISIENVMGIAATLDQLGQTSEVSSTAVSQLLTKMFKDTATFANIAGVETEKFTELLKTDANQALILFLQGLQKNNGGLAELAEKFDDLNVDGTRSISVIGALANNIDILQQTQRLSNIEFEKGTSLTNEFNVKNDNMASNLEKVARGLKAAFVNSSVMDGLDRIVSRMADWFKIPLSEKIADEAVKVNALVSEMTDYNISSERRNELYDKLKQIAPDVLEGINQEAISVDTLTQNLAAYNDQMINRIVLQQKQEEVDATAKTAASARLARIKLEAEIRGRLLKLQQNITKVDADAGVRFNKIMNDQTKTFGQKAKAALEFSTNFYESLRTIETWGKKAPIDKDFNKLMETYVFLMKEEQALFGETKKLSEEKTQLADELGLSTKKLNTDTKNLNDTEKNTADEVDNVTGSYAKLSERLGELDTKIKDYKASGQKIPGDLLAEYNSLYQQKEAIDRNNAKQLKNAIGAYKQMSAEIDKAREQMANFVAQGRLEDAMKVQETIDLLVIAKQKIDDLIAAGGDITRLASRMPISPMTPITNIPLAGAQPTGTMTPRQTTTQTAKDDKEFNEEWYLDQAQTVSDATFDIWRMGQDARLDYEIKTLNAAMDKELSNKRLTEEQKDKIREKYAKKEKALKTEAFKKQKAADIIQSVINTALAVVNALARGGPAAPALAVAAGIAGAAQTAVIAAQPIPAFYAGGDTGKGIGLTDQYGAVAGVVHANEYVVPEWMRGIPQVMAFERIMEGIRTSRGYAGGGNVTNTSTVVNNQAAPAMGADPLLISVINRLNDNIEKGIRSKLVLQEFEEFTDKHTLIEQESGF